MLTHDFVIAGYQCREVSRYERAAASGNRERQVIYGTFSGGKPLARPCCPQKKSTLHVIIAHEKLVSYFTREPNWRIFLLG